MAAPSPALCPTAEPSVGALIGQEPQLQSEAGNYQLLETEGQSRRPTPKPYRMLQVDRDAGTNSWLAPGSLECWELRVVNRRNLLLGSLFAAGTAMRLLKGTPKAVAADSNSFEIVRNEEEWRRLLTPAQFHVLRKHGTERAGSSPLDHEFRPGTYLCVGCDLELYKSDTKFNSGTGWPSFWAPIEGAVGTSEDRTLFTSRTEVHCRRCGGHLGHVFKDGPPPTGLRYCMNGIALRFVPA